jgi:hypothetical protein
MLNKLVAAGAAGAVILGAGTASLAMSAPSGSSTAPSASTVPSASATAPGSAGAAGHYRGRRIGDGALRRALHAEWVTKGKNGTFITHQAIRGQVSAVSATSITVKAADSVSQTYTVTSTTKVHTRAKKRGAAIADVHTGDPVLVAGTGTGTLTATQVADAKK